MKRAQKNAMNAKLATQVAALPWRMSDGALQVLLVTSRRSRHWLLPKGWQMPSKNLAESALTEAFEEAGVLGIISDHPIGSYRYLKLLDNGRTVPSQALVFGMEVTEELAEWPEIDQRSRAWFKIKDAAERVDDQALAFMLRQIGSMDKQLLAGEAVR